MQKNPRRSRTVGAALVIGALAISALVVAAPATAAATGTVTGTVVDDTGAPVAGLVVSARTGADDVLATTSTASDGSYRLTAPAGPRAICFDGTGVATASGGYRFTCFGGATAASATPVRVVADQVRPGVNGSVSRRAVISGRVTDSAGPLAGVGIRRSATGPVETTTGADGRYRLIVDPIDHPSTAVCFAGATATGGTSNAGYLDTCSAAVRLRPGIVRVVNQTLAPAAGAAGRVTDALGRPVTGAEVRLFLDDSPTTRTGADGRWRITGLTPIAQATLLATPPATAPGPDGTGLLARCYGGTEPEVGTCSRARAFALVAGRVTGGLDVALPSGGALSGVVTDKAGTPIPGVSVSPTNILDQSGQSTIRTTSDADGRWRAIGLEPGTYTVCTARFAVLPTAPDPDGYSPGCIVSGDDPRPLEFTVSAATTVTTPPLVLTGLGQVVGRVVDATTGRGVAGVQVAVGRPGQFTEDVARVVTGADGTYTVGALAATTTGACAYVTDAVTGQPPLGYADSCPLDGIFEPTRTFSVRERGITTAPTIRLAENGTVAGRVTDAAGFALQNVQVDISDTTTREFQTVTTDAQGRYAVAPIGAGQITVCFSDTGTARRAVDGTRPSAGYQRECWNDSDDPTPFTLRPGQQRTDIDATLAAARPTS